MSLLQLKNIHKRHLLWAKLFGICLFIHLVFLFWIFCIYRDNSYMLTLSINKKLDYSCPIMFVPLGTTPAVKPATTTKPTAQPAQNKTAITPIKQIPNKAVPTPKPTTVAAAIPNKTNPVKQEVAKVDVKKPEPAKQDTASSFAKASADTSVKPDVKPTPVAQALDTQQTVIPIIPPEAHVSHNYREVEALRKQAQLQKEIVQKWSPPIGVSPDCMCEVSFFVTSTGKIENIKIIKSSGVMMFDISVRQAIFAMKMPQWTYGKPLTISFKQ